MSDACVHQIQRTLTSAIRDVMPDLVEVFIDEDDTFLVFPDHRVRCQTPPEVVYAVKTHTQLDSGITLTLGPVS